MHTGQNDHLVGIKRAVHKNTWTASHAMHASMRLPNKFFQAFSDFATWMADWSFTPLMAQMSTCDVH